MKEKLKAMQDEMEKHSVSLSIEEIKNLISLMQERDKTEGSEKLPSTRDIVTYKSSIRRHIKDISSLESFKEQNEILKNILEENTNRQEKYNKVYEVSLNFFNEHPDFVKELNSKGGGENLINSFLNSGENSFILRAAMYKAAITYNEQINNSELESDETKQQKTKVVNIENSLYDQTSTRVEDIIQANMSMSLFEQDRRIKGLVHNVQKSIENIKVPEGKTIEDVIGVHTFSFIRKERSLIINLRKKAIEKGDTEKAVLYEKFLSNYTFIAKKAVKALEIMNGTEIEDDDNSDESFFENEDGENFRDQDSNSTNIMTTVGKECLRKISSITMCDGQGQAIRDELGYASFYDPSQIMGTLLNMTETAQSKEDITALLNHYTSAYPFCAKILDLMNKDEVFQTQLTTVCLRDRVTYVNILPKNKTYFLGSKKREADAVSGWKNNLKSGLRYSYNSVYDENGKINKENFDLQRRRMSYMVGFYNASEDIENNLVYKMFLSEDHYLKNSEGKLIDKDGNELSTADQKSLKVDNLDILTDYLNSFGINVSKADVKASFEQSFATNKNSRDNLFLKIIGTNGLYAKQKYLYSDAAGKALDAGKFESDEERLEKINKKREKKGKEPLKELPNKNVVVSEDIKNFQTQNREKAKVPSLYMAQTSTINKAFSSISRSLHSVNKLKSDTTIYSAGKTYTTFALPSFITSLEKEIKHFKGNEEEFQQMLEDKYGKYEMYAEKSKDGKVTWKNALLGMISEKGLEGRDSFRLIRLLDSEGTPYKEFSEDDYVHALFSMVKTPINKDTGSQDVLYYGSPILSDKDHMSFFTAPNFLRDSDRSSYYYNQIVNDDTEDISYDKDHKMFIIDKNKTRYNANDAFHKAIINLFYQETQRIELCQERSKNKETNTLPCFDKRGQHFCFFTNLNKDEEFLKTLHDAMEDIKGETDKKIITKKINDLNTYILNTIYKDVFKKDMEDTCKYFFEQGIYKNRSKSTTNNIGNNSIQEQYKELFVQIKSYVEKNENKIKEADVPVIEKFTQKTQNMEFIPFDMLRNISKITGETYEIDNYIETCNFCANTKLACANYIQMTSGDLAFFKSYEDFCKRQYQIEAQTRRLDINAKWEGESVDETGDGTFYMLVLDDVIGKTGLFDPAQPFIDAIPDKNLKAVIRKLFKEVNETDGQSLRTLPGYRKVMIMAGEWNKRMEKSYKLIMSGKIDYSDFDSVYKVLKPFLYALVEMQSKVEGHTNILSPIQVKNSECPLFAIIALLSAKNQNFKGSKLYQLNEFMVKNHIDSVGFNSTIKVGNSRAVPVSDEDFGAVLEKYAGTEGNFDLGAVRKLNYKNWGVQTPTKEHFVDKKLAVGTQIKRIVTGNFKADDKIKFNGEEKTAAELKKEYDALFLANSLQKLKGIEKTFSSPARLRYQLAKSASPLDGDMYVEALSLRKDGSFGIPLYESSSAVIMQQKLSSLLKKRTTRNEFKGGTAVQLSCFGTEDLNIVFRSADGTLITKESFTATKEGKQKKGESDEDYKKRVDAWIDAQYKKEGNSIDRIECFMPMYSKSLMEAAMDEDGKVDINKLPEELRRVIGYRTPTEAKYSINNLYIKGFLPSNMAGTIILPKEITLLTGSDFDIDKLYLLFRENERFKSIRENIDSSKVKMVNSRYGKNNIPDGIDEERAKNFFQMALDTMSFELGGEEVKDYSKFSKILIERNEKLPEDLRYNGEQMEYFRSLIPTNIKLIVKDDIREVKYDEGKSIEENSFRQRNNRILDIMQAFLSAKESAKELLTPGGFPMQERSSLMLRCLSLGRESLDKLFAEKGIKVIKYKEEEPNAGKTNYIATLNNIEDLSFVKDVIDSQVDPISLLTQVKAQQRNMIGKQLLAISAVYNTSLFELQWSKLSVNPDKAILLNGHRYTDLHNPYIIDDSGKETKMLKSSSLNGYLSAAVDNGKNPVLPYMGLNMKNMNVALTLSSLGYSTDEIGILFNQPVLQDCFHGLETRQFGSFKYASSSKKDEIIAKLTEMGVDQAEIDNALEKGSLMKLDDLAQNILDKEDLSKEELISQLQVLDTYAKAEKIAGEYSKVTKILRGDSSHGGILKTIGESVSAINAQKALMKLNSKAEKNKVLMNTETVYNEPEGEDIHDFESIANSDGLVTVKTYQNLCTKEGFKLLGKYFPQARKCCLDVYQQFLDEIGADSLDEELTTKFFDDFIMYAVSSNSFYGSETIQTEENGQIIEQTIPGSLKRSLYIKNFPQYFATLALKYGDEILTNPFINKLSFSANEYRKNNYVITNRRSVVAADETKTCQEGWNKLLYSKNEEVRNLAVNLQRYLFYLTGNKFTPQGFTDFLSYAMKCSIPEYASTLENIDNIYVNPDIFIDQFVRNNTRLKNNSYNSKVFKYVKPESTVGSKDKECVMNFTSKAVEDMKDEAKEALNGDENALNELAKKSAIALYQGKAKDETNPSYIRVGFNLYKNVKVVIVTATGIQKVIHSAVYKEIKSLGDKNLMKEYAYDEYDYKGDTHDNEDEDIDEKGDGVEVPGENKSENPEDPGYVDDSAIFGDAGATDTNSEESDDTEKEIEESAEEKKNDKTEQLINNSSIYDPLKNNNDENKEEDDDDYDNLEVDEMWNNGFSSPELVKNIQDALKLQKEGDSKSNKFSEIKEADVIVDADGVPLCK